MSLTHQYSQDWQHLDPSEVFDALLIARDGKAAEAKVFLSQVAQSDLASYAEHGREQVVVGMTVWPSEPLPFAFVFSVVVHLTECGEKYAVQKSRGVRSGRAIVHHMATATLIEQGAVCA